MLDLKASAGIEDKSFDVVHAHQVLLHLEEPVQALREMRRVARKVVACRDGIMSKSALWPSTPLTERWLREFVRPLWRGDTRKDHDAGAKLVALAVEAGWQREDVDFDVTVETFTGEVRATGFYEWVVESLGRFGDGFVEEGVFTREEVERLKGEMGRWVETDGAWAGFMNGEMLCWCR